MNIGIYARKSVYSDKSDSIDNQIKFCKEYIERMHPDSTYIIYDSDEGLSGKNDNRPDFKRMMKDAENGIINMIVCYKLDRFSRNVSDFSKYFEILQKNNVEFVSATENIDTSTPLGRAMMYICSVFAQMERENTADRVRDNMLELAKSGKWTGGRTPLGYKTEKIIADGKKHTILTPDSEEIPLLNMFFDLFLSGMSLMSMERKFLEENIKTMGGKRIISTYIHKVLTNPHFVENTPEIYDFFKKKGCIMVNERSEYNGENGLIVYGRTVSNETHSLTAPEKWCVSIGLHKPLISSEKWLKVQDRFIHNTFNKKRKYDIGILNGSLRCECGGLMKAKRSHDKKYNKIYGNYMCYKRTRYGDCEMKQISIDYIDNLFIDKLKGIKADKSILYDCVNQKKETIEECRSEKEINKDINSLKSKIHNLTESLQESSASAKYIIQEIEKLDSKINILKRELLNCKAINVNTINKKEYVNSVYEVIEYILLNFDTLSYKEKNDIIRDTFKCVWDGSTLNIFLM